MRGARPKIHGQDKDYDAHVQGKRYKMQPCGYLGEIQGAAVNRGVDVCTLLRKCKILAAGLKNPEFDRWIDQELNGYKDNDSLPNYRVLEGVLSGGDFCGIAGSSLRNADIPLYCTDKKFRENLERCYLIDPISFWVEFRGFYATMATSRGRTRCKRCIRAGTFVTTVTFSACAKHSRDCGRRDTHMPQALCVRYAEFLGEL